MIPTTPEVVMKGRSGWREWDSFIKLQPKTSLFRAGMKIYETQEANKNLMMSTSDNIWRGSLHLSTARGMKGRKDCLDGENPRLSRRGSQYSSEVDRF